MTLIATGQAMSFAQWLPPLLMVTGVALLGVVAALMLRSRRRDALSSRQAQPPVGAPGELSEAAADALRLRQEAQHWVAQLDRRITELRNHLARTNEAPPAPAEPPPAPAGPINIVVETVRDVGERPAEPRLQALAGPRPLVDLVHELADSGRAPSEIASHLHEHVGKVELILALRAMNGARPADRN